MRYTHIIWDFNGTVISDMQTGIDSVNIMLEERGLPVVDGVEEYREIFDFPVKEYYRRLGFDFSAEPYDELAHKWVLLYKENSCKITPSLHVREVLEKIRQTEIVQHILSASEQRMLEYQLEHFGLKNFFEKIYGLSDIYAEGKIELTHIWHKDNPGAVPLFVGDTVHDADTARALGCDCILYSGGHQSRKRLEKCGVPVVDSLKDVLCYLDTKFLF